MKLTNSLFRLSLPDAQPGKRVRTTRSDEVSPPPPDGGVEIMKRDVLYKNHLNPSEKK